METKNKVFEEHLQEWLAVKGNRKERREIVTHMVFTTKCHPKSVSRTFKRLQMRDPARTEHRGRQRYYGHAVTAALEDVWEAGDRACGELLHPMIREYVTVLQRDGQWEHGDEATAKLLTMSETTVKRRATTLRKREGGENKRTVRDVSFRFEEHHSNHKRTVERHATGRRTARHGSALR